MMYSNGKRMPQGRRCCRFQYAGAVLAAAGAGRADVEWTDYSSPVPCSDRSADSANVVFTNFLTDQREEWNKRHKHRRKRLK